MIKRRTNRWPFAFFMNMLDVMGVAAFVIWMIQHPQWQGEKKNETKALSYRLKQTAHSAFY
jgi:hypothetical protein